MCKLLLVLIIVIDTLIRKFLGIGIAIVYLTYIEMKDLIIFLMSLIIPYRLSIRT